MSGNPQQPQRDLIEQDVFLEFSKRSRLTIDEGSIEKRRPPEPDILCRFRNGEMVAFELKELCSENQARAISHLLKTGHEQPKYIRDGDPEDYVLKQTLGKRYVTEHPIELLLYTDGRIGTTAFKWRRDRPSCTGSVRGGPSPPGLRSTGPTRWNRGGPCDSHSPGLVERKPAVRSACCQMLWSRICPTP